MAWVRGTRGVLLDVDGTLLLSDKAAPGAAAALDRLREAAIPFRLTTNTTRMPSAAVARALRRAGVDVRDEDVLAPSILARRRILDSGKLRSMLLVPAEAREDFEGTEAVDGGAA